jgi:enolase-phosphatase E1
VSPTVDCVLLDIEGTTTPISFVHDTLFPYARARAAAFLERGAADAIVDDLAREHARERARGELLPAWADGSSPERRASAAAFVSWLMDRDRKLGPLKTQHGLISEDGYATGALRGEVYPDVKPAFERWTKAERRIAIFSSGSVLAQQLLFRHSSAGDLTPYLSGYFDTSTGPKVDTTSYTRIADALHVRPANLMFVSDVVAELDAARDAGYGTRLSVRPPDAIPRSSPHEVVPSFDAI